MKIKERRDLVEEMARSAHSAWMRAQRLSGVSSRAAPWGEEFMVPFRKLSERGREFDRIIMRAILAAFRRKGYCVQKDALAGRKE
jgi:hypothetical protein